MIIGSHNSWSYLKPSKWWLWPFIFMAKCQSKNLIEQYYKYNIRCFDLRVRFNKYGKIVVAHGFMEYDINYFELSRDLQFINERGDCYVRIIHEVRNRKQYDNSNRHIFTAFCDELEQLYRNIKFYCGRNLYNWEVDYPFKSNPSEEEKHASVCLPKYIDDWWPWLYAKFNNKKIKRQGTNKDILMIDFVQI